VEGRTTGCRKAGGVPTSDIDKIGLNRKTACAPIPAVNVTSETVSL